MRRIAGIHARFARLVTIAVVAVVGLNVALAIPFAWRDWRVHRAQSAAHAARLVPRPGQPKPGPRRDGYQLMWVDLRSYEGVDPARVEQVLDDFFALHQTGFRFEPHTHFSEPELATATLNLRADETGLVRRLTPHPASRSRRPFRVYAFGGSSTLGWNVADEWTYPSYLGPELARLARGREIEVRNYGRSNYSWFQEMVLFQRLLAAGHRPDAVVFLDGINVYNVQGAAGVPQWTAVLQAAWDDGQFLPAPYPRALPLFRLWNALARRRAEAERDALTPDRHPAPGTESLDAGAIRDSYLRTLDQIDALAESHGVVALFFWQPNRAYRCETTRYSQPLPPDYLSRTQALYAEMEKVSRPRFHNLSRLCETMPRARLFVDDVHYSPAFNQRVAREVASRLALRTSQ